MNHHFTRFSSRFFLSALTVSILLGCTPASQAQQPLTNPATAKFEVKQQLSPFTVDQTVERLKKQLSEAGLTLFTEVDHGANAIKVQKPLRPTVLLIFGNPDIGTQLMQENPLMGLELPLKFLVWRNAQDQVWISWTAPAEFAKRYDLPQDFELLNKIDLNLQKLAEQALK